MDIVYVGNESFLIKTKASSCLILGLSDSQNSAKLAKNEPDIVLSKKIDGNYPLLAKHKNLSESGEYEVMGISFIVNELDGFYESHIELEGQKIFYVRDVDVVNSKLFDYSDYDILLFVITSDAFKKALEKLRSIDPSVIILACQTPELLESFKQEFGAKSVENTPKFSIKPNTKILDELKLVVLERKS